MKKSSKLLKSEPWSDNHIWTPRKKRNAFHLQQANGDPWVCLNSAPMPAPIYSMLIQNFGVFFFVILGTYIYYSPICLDKPQPSGNHWSWHPIKDVYIFHKRQLKEDFGHLYAKLGFTIQAARHGTVDAASTGGWNWLGAGHGEHFTAMVTHQTHAHTHTYIYIYIHTLSSEYGSRLASIHDSVFIEYYHLMKMYVLYTQSIHM